MGDSIGGFLGMGGEKSQSESYQESKSWPVTIPRLPPVIPRIGTGAGSYISVTPTYYGQQTPGLPGATIGGPQVGPTATEQLNTPWWSGANIPSTPGVAVFGGETGGLSPVEYLNKIVDPGRYEELKQQQQQEAFRPPDYTPTGLDIQVSLDPSIATTRAEIQQGLVDLSDQVQGTITDIQGQIETVKAIELPDIDTARFEDISAMGDQQRVQLGQIDTQLGQQIGQLDQMYKRLGENQDSFLEARTRDLMTQRERARRDAARRGLSGSLASLATNPYDSQIADQRAEAQQEIEEARLHVRAQQRQLQETRLQVQRQFEEVRQGELNMLSEKFKQTEARFQAELGRETTAANLQEMVLGGQQLLQSILKDRSGLNAQAMAQELAELGLGMEVYQMVIGSQLAQPTGQRAESYGESVSEAQRQGDILGDIGRIATGIGGLF